MIVVAETLVMMIRGGRLPTGGMGEVPPPSPPPPKMPPGQDAPAATPTTERPNSA
ncbi:MAG: hypothetical protein AABZ08_05180 [Planctomycetota bacterium]